MDVIGVIDIGSNTVHMLVAASDGIEVRPIYDTSEHLRLGADLELLGAISPTKVVATAATVRRYVERAWDLGASRVRLLATQAVRASANRDAVVERIQEAAGVRVSVLEPEREAYFAVLGSALSHQWQQPHMVVDVGGASTQIIVAEAESLRACVSVPVGSGRLASRFVADPPGRDEYAVMRRRVSDAIGPAVAGVLEREMIAAAYGAIIVGGAMKRVARLVDLAPLPVVVRAAALHQAMTLSEHQAAGSIAASRGIEFDKVPMTRAGAMILLELLWAARLAECTISPFGIREGAILDAARTAPWQQGPPSRESALASGEPTRLHP